MYAISPGDDAELRPLEPRHAGKFLAHLERGQAGMTRDGVRSEAHPYGGLRHDLEVWSVPAPEWRAARARAAHNDH